VGSNRVLSIQSRPADAPRQRPHFDAGSTLWRVLAQAYEKTQLFEKDLFASFETDFAEDVSLLDATSALLLVGLHELPVEAFTMGLHRAGSVDADVEAINLNALAFIGIRVWRTMRAARAVLATGYEHECRAHDRITMELVAHRKEIIADHSGHKAARWLRDESSGRISARVDKATLPGFYANVSHHSHGDIVGVLHLVNQETGLVNLVPARTRSTRASLLFHAVAARDHAVSLADLAGYDIVNIQDLDDIILSRRDALAVVDVADEPVPKRPSM
jgi:hypothetical protein